MHRAVKVATDHSICADCNRENENALSLSGNSIDPKVVFASFTGTVEQVESMPKTFPALQNAQRATTCAALGAPRGRSSFLLAAAEGAESRSRRQTRHEGQSRCALCGFRCLLLQQQQKNASTAPRTKYFIFFSRESLSKKLASKSLLTDAKMLRKEKLENVLLGGMNCHSIPFTSRVPARRPNVRVTATKPNNFATDRKTKSNSGNY